LENPSSTDEASKKKIKGYGKKGKSNAYFVTAARCVGISPDDT